MTKSKIKPKHIEYLILALVIIFGFSFRMYKVTNNLDGNHVFRQSHVASNIYFYINEGLEIPSKMFAKNMEKEIFDFPLYQHIVAVVCSVTGIDLVLFGRLLNILIYILLSILLYQMMSLFIDSTRLKMIVLFIFALSPLNVFYNRAIIPDNLAILFSFVSLYFFLLWDNDRSSNKIYNFIIMVVAGVLATLIKNPIYFPIMICMLFYVVFKYRLAIFKRWDLYIFVFAIFVTVALYMLYSNYINRGDMFKGSDSEMHWYFSTLTNRMKLRNYQRLFDYFFKSISNPLYFIFFILGIVFYIKNDFKVKGDIFIGLLLGALITVFTFFNVSYRHNYYELGYVFIVSFFTGYFLDYLYRIILKRDAINREFKLAFQIVAFVVFFVTSVVFFNVYKIPFKEPAMAIANGKFLDKVTSKDCFIFYVIPRRDWDPQYLYFAKRYGYNVGLNDIKKDFFVKEINNFKNAGFTEFYLYNPAFLCRQELRERFMTLLNQMNGKVVAAEPKYGFLVKF